MKKQQHGQRPQKINRWKLFGIAFVIAASAITIARSQTTSTTPATPGVDVDQTPLTVQALLSPNIVLMLDDSGSMGNDVMPDYGYLSDTSVDGLVSADVNGVYYNPTVTYTPPYTADGTTQYPAPSFTSALPNGFSSSPAAVNLNSYNGGSDSSGGSTKPVFTNSFTVVTPTSTTVAPTVCASGTYQSSVGKCVLTQTSPSSAPTCASPYTALQSANSINVTCKSPSPTTKPACPGYVAVRTTSPNNGKCNDSPTFSTPSASNCLTPYTTFTSPSTCTAVATSTASLTCTSGYSVNRTDSTNNAGLCIKYAADPTCVTGDTPQGGSCLHPGTASETVPMFTYTVKNGSTYTRHYVGDAGKCVKITVAVTGGSITSAQSNPVPVNPLNCHDTDAVRQNVANWFSYYHTRMLMAKTGLMNTFTALDPTIRIGFGSIDGGTCTDNTIPNKPCAASLGSDYYPFTTVAGGNTYKTGLSLVNTFDSNCAADPAHCVTGDSGTQRAKFWNWIGSTTPTGYTPLRQALNAVGQYYLTDHPWQTSSTDTEKLACRQSYTILTTDGFWNDANVSIPTTPSNFGTNVDGQTTSTTTSTLDQQPAQCLTSGYSLNKTDSTTNPGLCVKISTTAPTCSSPYSIQGSGTTSVTCGSPNPASKLPTCSNSGTFTKTPGSGCNKGSARCTSSPWTNLTGIGGNALCEAPTTATPSCSSGTLNTTNSSSNPGLCVLVQTKAPTCPTNPTYTLTNANTTSVDCERTTSTTTVSPRQITKTGPNGQTYIFKDEPPYSDANSNTLADVAMYYWLSDLRSDMQDEVPTSTDDPAFWQHMTTFTVGLGFTPQGITMPAGKTVSDIFSWAVHGGTPSNFSWPLPASDDINNIADLAHAAVNGHGGFYSATNPQTFASGLKDALKRVSERQGSGASLAANSTKLDTGTTTYQAVYFTGQWKGDLTAYPVDPSSGAISSTYLWTAAGALPAAANRVIKTTANGTSMIDFVAGTAVSPNPAGDPPNLTQPQLDALGTTAAARNTVVNYLRGDSSAEVQHGGTLRSRDTALGDIVNSQPVYVGAPDPNLFFGRSFSGTTCLACTPSTPLASTYARFAADNASRKPRLWVAANDGMLHAFNASPTGTNPAPGQETFAYMPGAVILAGVKNLSSPDYGGNSVPHQYYNDGELTVADVYFKSTAVWHTVLVGTTGRGQAKAVYALDITDPDSPSLLWEHSSADSHSIGQIIGKPVIAQTADGSWSVLIGNGYNSFDGAAALLKFDIQTGNLSVYPTDSIPGNGLAPPAVWMATGTDGISTAAYAGDLKGNVWAFNLTTTTPAVGTIIFTAKDGTATSSNAQPITAGLLIGKDPSTGKLWLFFGTGRYLTQPELKDQSVQSWYGIIVPTTTTPVGRSDLVQRTIAAQVAGTSTKLAARGITVPTAGDMSGKLGWYINLVPPDGSKHGERMVTPNQFQGNLLLGTSRVPESSDVCNPSGSGWIMAVNPFTGAPPISTYFDINNDGNFDDGDKITSGGVTYVAAGVGFDSFPNNPIFVGNEMLISFDNATTGRVNTAGTPGLLQRLSWRELIAQ